MDARRCYVNWTVQTCMSSEREKSELISIVRIWLRRTEAEQNSKVERAPILSQHTKTLVHERKKTKQSEPIFQCTRRNSFKWIKTHLANLPQSANTVVKMTGLPDLTHLLQPVCKLRVSFFFLFFFFFFFMNDVLWNAHKRDILDTALMSGLKEQNKTYFAIKTFCPLMPEVTLQKKSEKKNS